MAQENGNSTMEMGTSDQVLVQRKKKKTLLFWLGGVAMVVVIAVVIALVVLLSGNEGGSVAEPIISTTEGPTTVVTTTTTTTSTTTTTTPAPVTEPEPEPEPEPEQQPGSESEIDLNSIINGVFSSSSFNGSWSSDNEILYQGENGNLLMYNLLTGDTSTLVQNTSLILQQASRVIQLSPDSSQVVLAYNVIPVYRYSFLARYVSVDLETDDETEIIPTGVRAEESFIQNFVWGASGTQFAFVYLNNIYYQPNLTADAQQITTTGQISVIYHGIPDWVYEEEVFLSNNAMWFSSDGSKLAYVTFNDTDVRVMRVPHFGVPGSIADQYTTHREIRYPKPGTTNPTVSVTLRDLETGESTVYDPPTNLDEPILKVVRFVTNETIALMWTDRVQTNLNVVICTLGQDNCEQIFEYSEPNGWIDGNPLFFNDEGDSFITILPQPVNGVRYKQIVQGTRGQSGVWAARDRTNTAHTVAEIMRWTPDDTIWYKANHVNDSAAQHVYTVSGGGAVSCFTCEIRRTDGGRCLYNDAALSNDGSLITVNCAGPAVPQILIYDALSGNLSMAWDTNEQTAALVRNFSIPETIRLSVPIAAGVEDADVQIQVPRDYLNRTNVPLLINVYGGPDTALVTQQWGIDWGSSLVSRWGVAVAHIDGRGGGLHGVDNMFAINRQLGTYEIQDQITATRWLQENLAWVDANRTCIWGWSYGGYAASLALARGGDVFRCAAAVAPVVDWRFYDTIYTERYMDTPQNNPDGYRNSTLLTAEVVSAYRNKRYMLIHGTADDNVHYQHAMLISRLLQRSDVYFTQMSYTDEDHSLIGVRPHMYHGLEKFLQDNML